MEHTNEILLSIEKKIQNEILFSIQHRSIIYLNRKSVIKRTLNRN